jgi:hypothetical protein
MDPELVGLIRLARSEYGFDGVLIDARGLTPCYSEEHDHVPGQRSLYAQARAVADFFEKIRALRPGITISCNLGFNPLLPQFIRHLDSIYLTDPSVELAIPGLSLLKLMDDSRRAQSLEMIEDLGVPPDRNQNCEYYLLPDAPLTDEKTFEYGVLQGLAVVITPKDEEYHITLDNYGQREAILFEACQALGVKRFSFSRKSYAKGVIVIALVPIIRDIGMMTEAIKNTPILENSRKARKIMNAH